jgi:hypothetical protein
MAELSVPRDCPFSMRGIKSLMGREGHKDRIILNDLSLHDAIMACEEMSQ